MRHTYTSTKTKHTVKSEFKKKMALSFPSYPVSRHAALRGILRYGERGGIAFYTLGSCACGIQAEPLCGIAPSWQQQSGEGLTIVQGQEQLNGGMVPTDSDSACVLQVAQPWKETGHLFPGLSTTQITLTDGLLRRRQCCFYDKRSTKSVLFFPGKSAVFFKLQFWAGASPCQRFSSWVLKGYLKKSHLLNKENRPCSMSASQI